MIRRRITMLVLALAGPGVTGVALTGCSEGPATCSEVEPPTIACGDAITRACTGPRTAIVLDAPSVMASCPDALGAPSSDAPTAGFPIGATTVTWTALAPAGAPLSCEVLVTIDDDAPPAIDCAGAPRRILRTSAADPITIAAPSATDVCDASVEVTIAPQPTAGGAYTLTATATDDAARTATCTWDLTIVDAFAPTGLRIVSAELASDGSTDLTIAWDPSESADVTEIRIERADALEGPFAELATVPAAITTYTDASMPSPRAFYRLVAIADTDEGGTSEPIRALAILDDEYHLRDQTVPSVPFATSLYGVVRHPVDLAGGPYPLVIFFHGNHGNCRPADGSDDECATRTAHECSEAGFTTTPNAEGYVYLQETLAAQGYVTASLSANALNCREDFILERVQLLLEHLRRWAAWSTSGGAPFGTTFTGVVDLSRVALVGHSRGGEAVALAPAALRATPVAGLTLASVFAIGPTDYHDARPSGVPFAVLLPGCDADVQTLEGLQQYDRGLDASDANARAQVLYSGANHNFFNTEWRFDDNAGRGAVCSGAQLVGGAAQRGMLEIVLADWIASTTNDVRLPAYVRAESDTPSLIDAWAGRPLDLRWSYAAAMRRVIDDFEGTGAPMTNDLGGANAFTGYTAAITCTDSCAGNYSHLTDGIRLAWMSAPASSSWPLGDLDASAYDVVSMRFASRLATINDGIVEHDLAIRVRDTSGVIAEVPLTSAGHLFHRYPSAAPQEILTTVRVPLSALRGASPTLDLAHLAAVEIAMPIPTGTAQGSIWVANVELAGD